MTFNISTQLINIADFAKDYFGKTANELIIDYAAKKE